MESNYGSKFLFYMDQQNKFVDALIKYDDNIWFPPPRGKQISDNKATWYIGFLPKTWGQWKESICGVHFAFLYSSGRGRQQERIRLPIGVEEPMSKKENLNFKNSVLSCVNNNKIIQSGFFMQAKQRSKLLEVDPIPFDKYSWEKALEKYICLSPVINVISNVIKEYYDRNAFNTIMSFPAR